MFCICNLFIKQSTYWQTAMTVVPLYSMKLLTTLRLSPIEAILVLFQFQDYSFFF